MASTSVLVPTCRCWAVLAGALAVLMLPSDRAVGEEPAVAARPEKHIAAERTRQIRTAVERGLQVVQKAARNYPKHRQCFSCHHQTLPLFAMKEAKDADFKIDEKLFKEQVAFTRKSFRSRMAQLKEGKGIGGRAMTVAYGLWTLYVADAERDDLSDAMVTFLLKTQEKSGRWRPPSHRPPLEESAISCTKLAIIGLKKYRGERDLDKVDAAVKQARIWLKQASPKTTEDLVFVEDHALHGAGSERERSVLKSLIEAQHRDGGWAQQSGMASDAYATGQAVIALLGSERRLNDPAVKRGIDFLLKTQQPDGSWFVKTRSRPVQKFFDNGDPHGKSQFISIAATSWATAALAQAAKKR